jgi:hypothetical protein
VRVARLDDIGGVRIGDALWKPIRSTLGVRAFGVNAYVCENAGDRLLDEHDETESGAGDQRHEELYLVLTGRAAFTVEDHVVDAPAGTFVFVDDPAARRAAVATERATTVLALGGPVGHGYEVAPWEYWFRVRAAEERRDFGEARAIAAEGLARYPDDRGLQEAVERFGV